MKKHNINESSLKIIIKYFSKLLIQHYFLLYYYFKLSTIKKFLYSSKINLIFLFLISLII